jgi:hypothetical protein
MGVLFSQLLESALDCARAVTGTTSGLYMWLRYFHLARYPKRQSWRYVYEYNAPNASALCQLFQKSKPLALSSALHLIHGKALFHCELPHDVVYGPVGLVSVDYSTSLTEVIVQVIDHALPSIVEVDPYKTPDWVLLSLELLLNVCYRSMGITQPRELDLRFLCSKVVKYYPWYNLHSRDFCSLYGRAW